MMVVVLIFSVRGLKHRYGHCCVKYGPLMTLVLSSFLIMAEPTRHILSDYNLWALCWNNPRDGLGQPNGMVRINQTWNDRCVWSSLEYHCNIPCCVPEEDFNTSFPDGVIYPETKNDTLLDLADPAWNDHFLRYKCFNESNPFKYNNTDFCDGGKSKSCAQPNCGVSELVERYECVCDACVFSETLTYLAPVGIVFTISLTYSGFVLLAIGSFWQADIISKIKKLREACRKLKEQREKKNLEAAGAADLKKPILSTKEV